MQDSTKTETPGPGAYESRANGRKKGGAECTFGSRESVGEFGFSPGPGRYFPEVGEKRLFRFAMAQAKRQNSQNAIYTDKYYDSVNLYEGPKIGFPRERRFPEDKYIRRPGPGSYDTISYIGKLPDYASKVAK